MEQKKIIPKFKKKLIGFLSDESARVTKEDILTLGLIGVGIGMLVPHDAMAAHSNVTTGTRADVWIQNSGHGNNNFDQYCISWEPPPDDWLCNDYHYSGGGHGNSPAYSTNVVANPRNTSTNGHLSNYDPGFSATTAHINQYSDWSHVNGNPLAHANRWNPYPATRGLMNNTNSTSHSNVAPTHANGGEGYQGVSSVAVSQLINGHLNQAGVLNFGPYVHNSGIASVNETHTNNHASHGSHGQW